MKEILIILILKRRYLIRTKSQGWLVAASGIFPFLLPDTSLDLGSALGDCAIESLLRTCCKIPAQESLMAP